MNCYGIEVNLKNKPKLDPTFIPAVKFNSAFLLEARKPVFLAIERPDGQMATMKTFIRDTKEMEEANCFYINRLVKSLLWIKGGHRIYISGDKRIYEYLKESYSKNGRQQFDCQFMEEVFRRTFEVTWTDITPLTVEKRKKVNLYKDGCRIGFDAGGSDRKVSAVMDGRMVFSEEVVWSPKENECAAYHYDGILNSLKKAAQYLPHVDAVGISTAGIVLENQIASSSLFMRISKDEYEKRVRNIYSNVVKELFGDLPLDVANDGDVSALAGVLTMGKSNVLGLAMGTSEAAGYIDDQDMFTGWLNELAFVPVDFQKDAASDEWSMDIGCGAKYFSQDAVERLACRAGIVFDQNCTCAEKLKAVQRMAENGNTSAQDVFRTIGAYLGHSIAYYEEIYHCENILLQGRVTSGIAGQIILEEAKRVLADEYAGLYSRVNIMLPNEDFRRLGQSTAAAFLPKIG